MLRTQWEWRNLSLRSYSRVRLSVCIAKKLGVSRMDVQRFIGGEASMSIVMLLGCCNPKHRICEIVWSGKVL